jgi:hypothetical protein
MRRSLLLLFAALTAAPLASAFAAAAAVSNPAIQTGDTWDVEDSHCGGDDASAPGTDIEFSVINNNSEIPVSEVQVLSGGQGDCHDSAAAPFGWDATVQTDGTILYTAQTAADYIHAGQLLDGFGMGRHGDRRDCCRRNRAYGPGETSIHDDDDGRDHCYCSNVATAPLSWGNAKLIYR